MPAAIRALCILIGLLCLTHLLGQPAGQAAAQPARASTTRPAAPAPPTSQPSGLSLAEKMQLYQQLRHQLHPLLDKKDYASAADVCGRMIELAPADPEAHYNLACCLARLGKSTAALDELAQAIDHGFVDVDMAQADDDLTSLRDRPRFKQLLDKLAADAKAARDKIYEKGDTIPGVRTREGDPVAGLRWRLRMSPTASASQPDRLILWLHPSGGSANKIVESLAPELVKRGYALLVPTAKNWSGWTVADGQKFVNQTVADVTKKVAGIDARRPILFGYSAGGQLALVLWLESPKQFGGLVLDAAYPILPDPAGSGRAVLLRPSDKEGFKDCPLFVLLGEQDASARVWVLSEDAYRKAGVPLTIYYVAGAGHEWLFGGAQRDKLYRWLGEVSAGRLPGVAATRPDEAGPQPAGPRKPIRMEDVY
jgi:predicted esterase